MLHFEKRFFVKSDERVKNWLLMDNWWPTLLICVSYIFGVKVFTEFMKRRAQFEFRSILVLYNVTLVILSSYLFFSLIFYGIQSGFTLSCWLVKSKTDSISVGLASAFWLYYFSKIIELLDTMFFIARKKFNLVTFLHVYHHMSVAALSWLVVKYAPGGFMTITFSLNSFVHIFMYIYYALAAAGPKYSKFIWWKKYMTVLQMIQFLIMISHSIYVLTLDCGYPKVLIWLTLGNASIFLFLFCNYFISSSRSKVIVKGE